ncbi:hypothetical protein NP233_g10904 [Leucocoprinus birnbaumii]|uniref:Uncharacterized protein n=1 Tax=Leucocoprinus birnbaumii TaxID=56174 RepID=A0AAD5YRF8_9AGAR|nr:hypothetical protein NP233_g10904 [Leucocoprinus birnbaumii]
MRFSSFNQDTSRWSKLEVALELGVVLKLKQAQQRGALGMDKFPSSHSLFSRLTFTTGDGQRGQQVDEDVVDDGDQLAAEDDLNIGIGKKDDGDGATGGWLDSDDIEEF